MRRGSHRDIVTHGTWQDDFALPPLLSKVQVSCGHFKLRQISASICGGLSWTWLLPRVFELIGIRDLYYLSSSEKWLPVVDYD